MSVQHSEPGSAKLRRAVAVMETSGTEAEFSGRTRDGRRAAPSRPVLYTAAGALSLGALATATSAHTLSATMIVLAALLYASAVRFRNPFQMMWMSGHVTFCVMPVVIILSANVTFDYTAAALCSIFSLFMLLASRRYVLDPSRSYSIKVSGATLILSTLASVIIMTLTEGGSFLYITPVLIVAYALFAYEASKSAAVAGFVLLLTYTAIYILYYWSEFGRLVIAGVILVPTIVLLCRLNLDVAKIPLLTCVAASGLAGSLLRIEGASIQNIAAAALRDSAVSPILTAQDILARNFPYGTPRISEWLDQVALFFLAVFPRAWWPEKPFGFGFQYVVDTFPTAYINAGHSIAATFLGEHIYYLQSPLFIVGTVIAITLVLALYRACWGIRRLNGAGGLLVCIYLPTFYWGGLASFSARFLFGFIVFLGIALVLVAHRIVIASALRRFR